MSKPVRTTPLADLHILELDAWWREHREKAPDLFEQELALALRTIASAPHAGKRYAHPSGRARRVVSYVGVVAATGAVPRGSTPPRGRSRRSIPCA